MLSYAELVLYSILLASIDFAQVCIRFRLVSKAKYHGTRWDDPAKLATRCPSWSHKYVCKRLSQLQKIAPSSSCFLSLKTPARIFAFTDTCEAIAKVSILISSLTGRILTSSVNTLELFAI